MFNLFALLAPVALIVPTAAGDATDAEPGTQAPTEQVKQDGETQSMRALMGFDAMYRDTVVNQFRIERRFTIRVTPRSRQARQQLVALLPGGEIPDTFRERKIGKCLPVNGIVGVQATEGSRLLLFMRDQRIISAELEKACKGSAFYSGFYVDPTDDGNLCVKRDELRSRSGTTCEVDRIRQLVRVRG